MVTLICQHCSAKLKWSDEDRAWCEFDGNTNLGFDCATSPTGRHDCAIMHTHEEN